MTTTTLPICRMCGTPQKIHATRSTFARHPGRGPDVCRGSGRTRSEVDRLLRTFDCWGNTNGVARHTVMIDNADSISLINTLSAEGVRVEVATRLAPDDVLRLIDELGVIVRERGWRSAS